MISISSKSRYGLKALLDLAAYHGSRLVPLKEIAARQDIPRQYLEQIFNQLVKADIIKSVRGKHGGYTLARPPAEILASEVIFLLEGGIELVPVNEGGLSEAISELFSHAEEQFINALQVSLEELFSRQQASRNVLHFDI